MNNGFSLNHGRLLIGCYCLFWALQPTINAYASHTINTTPGNTGSFSDSDLGALTVNTDITQTKADGSGGTINLTAGTILTINSGATLNVSAVTSGKNGGIINLSSPAILINGVLRANGLGSGQGGSINLTGTGAGTSGNNYIQLGSTAILEAKGGTTGGLGGVINLLGNGNTYISTAGNAKVTTTGVSAAGANEIYVTGDGTQNGGIAINDGGNTVADSPSGQGGLIRFTTRDGNITVQSTARILARALGTGAGGTAEFILSNGGSIFTFASLFAVNAASNFQLYGNNALTNNGTLRFARNTSGTMDLDFSTLPGNAVLGVGTIEAGNWNNNNTTAINLRNYDAGTTLNAGTGGTAVLLSAIGNIDAATGKNNNLGTIGATSTNGAINIYDNQANMILSNLATAGNVSLNANAGVLTVKNANVTGTSLLQAKSTVNATDVNNIFTGAVTAYGNAGATDLLTNANISSATGLNVVKLMAGNTALTAGNGNLTLTNATVTAAATLNATGTITANNINNDFGTSVAAASTGGGAINIRDKAGVLTITGLSTSGNSTLLANTGALIVSGANMTGVASKTILQASTKVDASASGNLFAGKVSAYGNAGTIDSLSSVTLRSSGDLSVDTVNTSGAAIFRASGGDLTIANANISGNTTLNASGSILGTTGNDFGLSTSATAGTDITLKDQTGAYTFSNLASGGNSTVSSVNGNITVNLATVGGDLKLVSGSVGTNQSITLASATVTGNTTLMAGNSITANSANRFTGTVSAYGDAGIADYATSVNINDAAGDFNIARITATNGTLRTTTAGRDLIAANIATNNGIIDFIAPKNITVSNSTVDGTDTLRLNSANAGNVSLINNTVTSITGTAAAPTGTGGVRFGTTIGNVSLVNNTVSGATTIGSVAATMAGNITGSGNTYSGSTAFYTDTAHDITMTNSDFQSTINDFLGRTVKVGDNAGIMDFNSITATDFTGSTTGTDIRILNAKVTGSSTITSAGNILGNSASNVDYGTLTATAAGNIDLTEASDMVLNQINNTSAAGTTTLISSAGSVTGKGTAVSDIISTGTGAVSLTAKGNTSASISANVSTGGNLNTYANGKNLGTGDSVYLYGTIGGNFTAQNTANGNTSGDITMGEWETSRTLDVTGTTTFKTLKDALGYGNFTGSINGVANRVSWEQTGATDLTIGNVTANAAASSSTELFAGYGNVINLYAPNASIVDDNDANTVDLTANNGGITLWAGNSAAQTTSNIRLGISTGKDVYLWASGDTNGNGTGTSINVQTGNIGGSIIATNQAWDKTTGDIDINLTTGNLTTQDVGSARNINLTATNGSVLQNNAYNFSRGITVYSTGDTTIQAGDAVTDTGSYIDTGVYTQGNLLLISAGKSFVGTSASVVGQVNGTATVHNNTNTAVTGDVYLGTSIGNPDLLNDSPGVIDIYGNVNVNALGDIYLNGGIALNGAITAQGNSITIRQDIGKTKIASLITTKTTGTAVDILNYSNSGIFGDLSGVNITTAGTSNILLQAGNTYPSDNNAYIDSLMVNTGGNLNVLVTGDSNANNPGGVSVNITGTVGGTSSATNESGGATRGSVTMP